MREDKLQAINEFLNWRRENCPDLGFTRCWQIIMELRENGSNLSWVNGVRFHALREALKDLDSDCVDSVDSDDLQESKESKDNYEADEELLVMNVKLAKERQKHMDTNRIERKAFREYARVDNALLEASSELKSLLENISLSEKVIKHNVGNIECAGIIQLSDTHFNELINLKDNKYDFNVASKRLRLLADKAIKYFKMSDIRSIVICCTGDLLNKDDLLDKLLNNANNRMKACLLATSLVSQFILHLNQHFKITFCGITGNETRMSKDIAWSDMVVSDNYDLMLYHMLQARFINSDVDFIIDDPLEQVIDVAGNNILLIHGHQYRNDLAGGVKKSVAKYSYSDIRIDYVLSGHLHEAYISDNYSRSASMCGQNAYSDKGLQLSGRASQNIGIFYKNGNRDIIKVDLQNYQEVEGYDITKELEAYNTKSHDKLCQNKTVFKIVI